MIVAPKYILFDAANTLIHKPLLWIRLMEVLKRNGIVVPVERLKHHHKLISEVIHFPDRTSSDFYKEFNNALLMSFGIIPNDSLLLEVFEACSYLPWEPFEDTDVLQNIDVPVGILSNFNSSLSSKVTATFGDVFSDVFISEEAGVAKPNIEFYQYAVDRLPCDPSEVLYIGDSPKLDIAPGRAVGFQVALIDRDGLYQTETDYQIFRSLNECLVV